MKTITACTALALLAGGCAALRPAQMALPANLMGTATEALPVQGLGGGRSGTFTVGSASGRFERNADRAALLNNAVTFERGSARYTLQEPGATEVQAQCRNRQTTGQAGTVAVPLRSYGVACEWREGGKLQLEAAPNAARTLEARQGSFEAGGVQLDIASVHELQGSRLPLAQPAGYTLTHQGVVVGAVDLTSPTPLLFRPRAGQPLRAAVTQAALALAVLWDPAVVQP